MLPFCGATVTPLRPQALSATWYYGFISPATPAKGPFTSSDCDVAAISLPNLIYCFGVVLLHRVFVIATATYLTVTGESLCNPFGSNVAATS